MATIPGSHFVATAPGLPVNVVFDTGGSLPPTVPGSFNLEIFSGSVGNAPPAAAGYQGFAILSPSGTTIDLVGGAYAITDNGTGGDTINADGTNETISGGGAQVNLFLNGNNDVANGGAGNAYIQANGTNDVVNPGGGNDVVNLFSATGDTVAGGTGSDTITVFGTGNAIAGSNGSSVITVIGDGNEIASGSGNSFITAVGNNDTIAGGAGSDTINAFGNNDSVTGGNGNDTINVFGVGDTVTAGSGSELINTLGSNFTFNDSAATYNDTVVGFSQSAGDTIKLSDTGHTVASTTLVNGGVDTLITLSDNSTILLKGITHVDSGFFS